ncbi:MAG: FKBP-type peptidyl-prolyl cis-trans isomerase [Bacteroidetes bacterium]|nr:FKBP-type peptidyl-prolyl cis-trans isomerase [Bacteroidota bacterium]
MKTNTLYILLVAIVLSSCWSDSRFKGYTQTDTGLYYKLQMIGDGKHKPSIGDYLEIAVTYKTEKDSVFLDSYSSNDIGMVILPFNHSSFEGSFEEGLRTMNEGDSVSFIVDASGLFSRFFKSPLPLFLKPGSLVKMEVKLNKILNKAEYSAELDRYQKIVEDRDIEEQRKILSFIDTCKSSYQPYCGLYYYPIKQGSGALVEKGDIVRFHYTGSFFNGKVFESTYDRVQPMEFVFGEQGQVIRGLEIAISLMNEGSKEKFIIPSHLALGEGGSSTGIIPPYTSVIYEIELLNLTKK